MASLIKKEDEEFLHWSTELSKKKIDMRLPRLRVHDYMQEDPHRWTLNATLNRLKRNALQSYIRVEDIAADYLSLDEYDIEGYRERIESEVNSSENSLNTRDLLFSSGSSASTSERSDPSSSSHHESDDTHDEIENGTMFPLSEENYDDYDKDDDNDSTLTMQARLAQEEIDERVKEYLKVEHPNKYISSTTKLFSNSSITEDEEEHDEPVELKKIEEVPAQKQTETLQEILLTPMPGPGFRMAQVAHPDDIFQRGRRLPSVYFLKPRVRIFSAFPHCQQFWCRQGIPIPVPPPSKRNTFLDAHLLSANHPKVKLFPFRVRTYKANMKNFNSDELIFIVEGRNIFVTGEKRKGNKVIRTVTEEICLPIDLDLNYLRVAHTKKGEIIFEELWEYDGIAN